jgi:putative DNA primase/helicase
LTGPQSDYPNDNIPPTPLPVQWEAIPAELGALAQWVSWQYEPRDGQWTKPPLNVRTGHHASHADPSTWATRDEVQAAYEAGRSQGGGFVLTESDPYVAIDLDKCRDPATGEIAPAALAIVRRLNSYTEVSPSRRGLRILLKATLPPHGRRNDARHIEVYESLRYVTLTGQRLPGTPPTIEARQAELEAWHGEVWPESRARSNPLPPEPIALEDEDLRTRMLASKQGTTIARLMAGDTSAHSDNQSSADLALCNYLAFWFGRDPVRMDRVFRSTALYRAKWDERHYANGDTYGARTLAVACSGTNEVYTPPARWDAPRDDAPPPPPPPPPREAAACGTCPYTTRLAQLEAEVMVLQARETLLTATLDQERAASAELRQQVHALDTENAELRRRESESERLITNIMDWQRDPSTRDLLAPTLYLWQKRRGAIAQGKPPDTPIPWPLADLAQELGYHKNTAAKWTKQLIEHGVVDQTYKQLGHPEDGDYRREQQLAVVLDLPDDLPDALNRIRRCVREERPPRKVAQPRSACDACRSARCPEHPDAPIQKHVAVRCTVCDGNAAPDHTHAPQKPSAAPPPVVQFIRTRDARPPARGAESNHKNCADTYVERDAHKICDLTPPPGDVFAHAQATADAIAATLDVDSLPPAEAIPLRLAILRACAERLRAGQPPPTPTDTCDTCGRTLGGAEFIRCDGCATVRVA